MSWLTDHLGTPEDAHRVSSPEDYRRFALEVLAKTQRRHVPLIVRTERPRAYVSDGRWVVDCSCGNGPSASPSWALAICLECGAEYRPTFPRSRGLIEKLLLARSVQNRHFRPQDGETAATLRGENVKHGVKEIA